MIQERSSRRIQTLLASALIALPLLAAAQKPSQPPTIDHSVHWPKGFTLGPGDVIGVFVWEQPRLSKTVTIAPDGRINYPLIGEIDATGRSVPELQVIMSDKFKSHLRNPQVTVSLEQVQSYRVFVIGEVLRPGVFQLMSAVTVVEAIAMAGGFTPFASRDQILVYNPFVDGGRRQRFDYNGFVRGGGTESDIVLRPHDTVIVK